MTGDILTLNCGSSSVKFAVFDAAHPKAAARITGKIAGIGRAPVFTARDTEGPLETPGPLNELTTAHTHEDLIARLLDWLAQHHGDQPLLMVGHRVVHGGKSYTAPTRITQTVLSDLDALSPLAPWHQPHNLAAIRAVAAWQPNLPQAACFDTAFHRTQDRTETLFALPRDLSDEGIIRYGFHGLSYAYIASVLPDHLGTSANGRVIVAHLGNGASMCAMRQRKSVATSMGFTALDGLVMGRRCGTLDPGVILYLMQSKGMTAAQVETLLYRKSGLLGVSGISNSMQDLEASNAPQAREAIDLFVARAARTLAGMIPAISGLDAVVFTAGIGENSAPVRAAICAQLDWLGLQLDPKANARGDVKISAQTSAVDVLVLPTNEEAVIASACRTLLAT